MDTPKDAKKPTRARSPIAHLETLVGGPVSGWSRADLRFVLEEVGVSPDEWKHIHARFAQVLVGADDRPPVSRPTPPARYQTSEEILADMLAEVDREDRLPLHEKDQVRAMLIDTFTDPDI